MKHESQIFTRRIVFCSAMAALAAVIGTFMRIPVQIGGNEIARISFFMIPIMIVGVRYGPVYASLTAIVADFAKAGLTGLGFSPIMTIAIAVMGLLSGILFLKNKVIRFQDLLISSALSQFIGSIILNTIALSVFYGQPLITLWPRWIIAIINIPLFATIVYVLLRAFLKAGIMRNEIELK